MRLTPEREKEIRKWTANASVDIDQCLFCIVLLEEIDAIRQENKKLKTLCQGLLWEDFECD